MRRAPGRPPSFFAEVLARASADATYRMHGTTSTLPRSGPFAPRRWAVAWVGEAWLGEGWGSVQELLSAEVPWDMVDSDAELKAVFRTLSLDR